MLQWAVRSIPNITHVSGSRKITGIKLIILNEEKEVAKIIKSFGDSGL